MNIWIAGKDLMKIQYHPKKLFIANQIYKISRIKTEHVTKVWKAFEIKNLDEYHDLYVQCDTFLLAGAFENFRNKCIEIYKLDRAHFLSTPGLAWQACLKKTTVELELLTDIDML